MTGWGSWTRPRDPLPQRQADQAVQSAHVGMMIVFAYCTPMRREEQVARRERAIREMAAACSQWLEVFAARPVRISYRMALAAVVHHRYADVLLPVDGRAAGPA